MTVPIIAATSREPGLRARARVDLLRTMIALLALLLLTGGSAAGQDDGYTDADDVWTSKLQFDAFWLDLLTARAEANVAQGAFKSADDLAGLRSSLAQLADITADHMVTIQAIEPDLCWADLYGASMGSLGAWNDFATAFVNAIDTGDSSLARDGRGEQLLSTAAAADTQLELELQVVDCPWLPPLEEPAS